MEEGTRTFTYQGGEVTVRYKHKNRHREQLRRIYALLTDRGADPRSAQEFAQIVAYTVTASGDIWQPPAATAPEPEIVAAYEAWLDEVDTDLTDLWAVHIWNPPPAVTGPEPPAEDADPNSTSAEPPGKKAS